MPVRARSLTFGRATAFLRFHDLFAQHRTMVHVAMQAIELKQAVEQQLRVVAAYEGIPVDGRTIRFDPQALTVSWDEEVPEGAEIMPADFGPGGA